MCVQPEQEWTGENQIVYNDPEHSIQKDAGSDTFQNTFSTSPGIVDRAPVLGG